MGKGLSYLLLLAREVELDVSACHDVRRGSCCQHPLWHPSFGPVCPGAAAGACCSKQRLWGRGAGPRLLHLPGSSSPFSLQGFWVWRPHLYNSGLIKGLREQGKWERVSPLLSYMHGGLWARGTPQKLCQVELTRFLFAPACSLSPRPPACSRSDAHNRPCCKNQVRSFRCCHRHRCPSTQPCAPAGIYLHVKKWNVSFRTTCSDLCASMLASSCRKPGGDK